jgi:hypothetical protein
VLGLAHKRGWCDLPHFVIPKLTEGRTLYLFPEEAERLIAAAAPHLKPLLIFFVGHRCEVKRGNLFELGRPLGRSDGRPGDLLGRPDKSQKRRVAEMPPRVVAALANLPHRDGPIVPAQRRATLCSAQQRRTDLFWLR